MPPAHPRTGRRNAAITHQLFAWTERDGRGEAFDSSAGFFLKNGAPIAELRVDFERASEGRG